MEEVWKDLIYLGVKYTGSYKVSNLGRIKSITRKVKYKNGVIAIHKGKILKGSETKNGYLTVTIGINNIRKTCPIHKAVVETFIRIPKTGECVDHLAGITDNELFNLRITTIRGNCSRERSIKRGLPTGVTRTKNKNFATAIYMNHLKKNVYLGRYKDAKIASLAYELTLKAYLLNPFISFKEIKSIVNKLRFENNLKII